MPEPLSSRSVASRLTLALLALTMGLAARSVAQEETLLQARTLVPRGPYYVGEEIPLRVVVEPGTPNVEVLAPRLPEAEFHRVRTVKGETSVEGSGEPRSVPFRVIARRPGRLVIPAFQVRSGDRSTRTAQVVVAVRPVPAAGRSSAFLGGVGRLQPQAEAEPSTLPLGETFEFRIPLRGPGSLGFTQAPTLQGIDRNAVRIEILPTRFDLAAALPSRTFRWRMRPSRPGRCVIPPQPVATFDPRSQVYQTRATPAVAVQVEDVPAFDPAQLDYRSEAPPDRGGTRAIILILVSIIVILPVPVVAGLWWARRRRRGDHPRTLAARFARELARLGSEQKADEVARQVVRSLVAYLAAATGRPTGALTPQEAQAAIEAITADASLAERAAMLLGHCDWICYDSRWIDEFEADTSVELAREAANLFVLLACRGPEKPREAPGSATA